MLDLPPFDALALSLHHSPGIHAILVGSGLSRAAGIPTGWEITLDLIEHLAALDGVNEHDDWAQWYRNKYREEPSYSVIIAALASTSAERRAVLHRYIDAREGEDGRKPTKAHHAIARLVASGAVRVVITTNFDRLIENALREAGVEPTVIASDDAIAGATPLIHSKCTVIKVHGDYLDARIKNTDAELEEYSPALDALLDQVFDNFGLLVVGWSSEWDTALKSALLRAPSRRYALYWASRGEIRSLAQELVEQRGGRIFEIADADSFFLKLDETLLALKQASRPHPQSAEIAVALAKLYCRDDKFSMEWAEFLHVEVENVRQHVTASDYPNVRYNGETLNRIVNELLIRTEILRRASLICGRWGTIEANRAVGRAVQSLSFASPFMAGNVALVAMRELGASICFYWNMAGLLDRSDWKAVEELQRVKIKHTRGDVDAVTSLPFATYDSVDWKFLNELNNRSTPINDFLAGKFRSEARDISLNAINADELFDEVELAIALGFAHRRAQSGTDMWFPVGRFIWKNSGRRLEEELDKIESITDSEAFFKAGMLGGSKAAAALTLKEMRSHRQQIARYFR